MTTRTARILWGLLCVAVACLATAQNWARLTARSDPQAVLRVLPYSASALRQASDQAFVAASAQVDETVATLGYRLQHSAPLDDAPLMYAALEAASAGDLERAEQAMTAAVRFNPRNRVAHAWLVDRATQDGDYGGAIDHLAVLLQIDPANRTLYQERLAALALEPAARQAVLERLDPWPSWGNSLVVHLNVRSADIDFLFKLTSRAPMRARRRFLDRLVRGHDYTRAYLAWLEFTPEEQRVQVRWPHNASFAPDAGLPPFNWSMLSDQAEILSEGGLHATFLGRERTQFAEQVMLLPPGHYRFEASVEGRLIERSGAAVWSLRCARNTRELGSVSVQELSGVAPPVGFDFTVPDQDCAAQRLRFHGEPGDFPRISRILTRSVSITDLSPAAPT